jgi:NAD(P) transhydrogenase subunit alpha
MPADASRLYAKNVTNLLALMQRAPSDAGGGAETQLELVVDLADEVLDGACVVHDGAIRHEPTRQLVEGGAQGGTTA